MAVLALNYGQATVFLKDIAKGENISEKYLSLIIIPLRGVGLVNSSPRGARRVQPGERSFTDHHEGDCGCFGRRLLPC